MSATAFIIKSAVSPYDDWFPRIVVSTDDLGAHIAADGGAVVLTPPDMRKLAVELLDLAQQKDGKDWIEEVGRL